MRLHLVILVGLYAAIPPAWGHPGGLDKNGGHTDKKTGLYHVHRPAQGAAGSSSAIQATPPVNAARAAIPAASRDKDVQEYFRAANAGLAEKPLGTTFKRDVSGSMRERVLNRDGNRCVVCGSTVGLEVDHRVALENGGDNSLANLATLCSECHDLKTKLDNSLRRHWEKLTR